jgi:FkbM family methyltransferase
MSSTSQAQAEKSWSAYEKSRIAMTVSCRDTDTVPKVAGAGEIFEREGQRLQLMHEGTVVKADSYDGPWVTEIIRRLQGHHEPQEELLFHHLLAHCRPGSRMMEVGAFWAYYTCWFLRAVPGATAICMEPDSSNAECGRENLILNSLGAKWIQGFAGRHYIPNASFRQASNQQLVEIPCHNFSSLLEEAGAGPVELLHIDSQGAEWPFLKSLGDNNLSRQVRFVVVSTHHESISGSPKTHGECLEAIQTLGGGILEEHSVEESFSGDGLIIASFDPRDRKLNFPTISRNSGGKSLFGFPTPPGGEVNLVATENGPILVRKADSIIGSMLGPKKKQSHEGIRAALLRMAKILKKDSLSKTPGIILEQATGNLWVVTLKQAERPLEGIVRISARNRHDKFKLSERLKNKKEIKILLKLPLGIQRISISFEDKYKSRKTVYTKVTKVSDGRKTQAVEIISQNFDKFSDVSAQPARVTIWRKIENRLRNERKKIFSHLTRTTHQAILNENIKQPAWPIELNYYASGIYKEIKHIHK